MGGRGGSSGFSGGSGATIQGTDFVSFPPTPLNKQGERVVTLTDDGDYIYSRAIPNFSDTTIDTNSLEYKRALRDYNVKAQFNADGSVTVAKGGLFSRKQKFKSINDFQNEADKRIDTQVNRWKSEENRVKSGRLTQLEAEKIRLTVRNNTPSMALKDIHKGFKEQIATSRTYVKAGEDMKRRLKRVINNAKK